MSRVWPLVGRDEELRTIAAALRHQQSVVLAGEAGVGKTRLAKEALARVAGRGVTTRWVTGSASARGLPMGAFAMLVGAVGNDPGEVLPRAMEALRAEAGPRGLALGVDDAHLLDDVSALLLQQLVIRGVAAVIATIRAGETAPAAVTALWKDGLVERVELPPLSSEDTIALLECALDGPVDSAAAARMWALTAGNALFLRHLVDGERAAGRLGRVAGVWRWDRQPTLPPLLVEIVAARMSGLPDSVRDVLDTLAIGEPLGLTTLVDITDSDAVEDAEERGLVIVEPDGRRMTTRLAHPLYGDVRRSTLGVVRSRRLRAGVAEALARTGSRRVGDVLRHAMLVVDSDLPPEPELFIAAAQAAMILGDLMLARRLAASAVAAGGGVVARLALAHALTWLDCGEEAEAELAAIDQLIETDIERALVGLPRIGNLFFILRRPTQAQLVLTESLARIADASARRTLTAIQAMMHAQLGRPEAAITAALEALADAELPDPAVTLATWGLVRGLGMAGRASEAAAVVERGRAAAARSASGVMMGLPLTESQVSGLLMAGYLDEAELVAGELQRHYAEAVGLPHLAGLVLAGHAALARGELLTAIRQLREALAGLANGHDAGGWDLTALLWLVPALAMRGDPTTREALAQLESARHPGHAVLEPDLILARAWAAADAPPKAIALAREAATLAATLGQRAQYMSALLVATRLGDNTTALALAAPEARADGPRAPAAVAYALALANGDPVGLRTASQVFEDMGDRTTAADAAAQAAAHFAEAGLRGSALSCVERARRLAAECGGLATPAIREAVTPSPVTARQREVVDLAAEGLTNRQIAERLRLSVRTVEGHLYRAAGKTGARKRDDLGRMLRGETGN